MSKMHVKDLKCLEFEKILSNRAVTIGYVWDAAWHEAIKQVLISIASCMPVSPSMHQERVETLEDVRASLDELITELP